MASGGAPQSQYLSNKVKNRHSLRAGPPCNSSPPAPGLEANVLVCWVRMVTDIYSKLEGNLTAASRRSRLYVPWVKTAVVAALMWILFGTVLIDMANDWWTDPTLSQGLLIPPLALYIAWIRWHTTFSLPPAPDWWGFLLTGGACLVFIIGKLAAEFFLTRISFVILLAGLVWTFWGMPRLKTLAFPLLLLATMVPLPVIVDSAVSAPMQLFASDVATRVVQFLGVSVFRDGNIIYLAHVSLGVERACSGLSSLSALLVGSLLLGFLQCSRPVTRILLFASSIPISIGVNALRVSGTAVLADYDERFAMGFYHSFSGWLVFLLGFASLYLFCMLLCVLLERKRVS